MPQPEIGKIKKVPLREIWKKEDKDFTKWLEENIEYLNDILDFELTIISRETQVGPFRVDLFAEDEANNKVIIENQLEKSDHAHLGQLITYLVNLEAKRAIWITSNPTEEHEKAIEWLNEVTPDDVAFYLVKIEAIRIDDQSKVGPLFTIIEGPSPASKQLGAEKKEYAARHVVKLEFWTQLLERAKVKTHMFTNLSPTIHSWIGTGGGKAGVAYNFVTTKSYSACEIYLDRGKDYEEPNVNKQRFDEIIKHKQEIETALGNSLSWERLDGKRACRIAYKFPTGYTEREKWADLQDKMIDMMIKIENVFRSYIKSMR